MAALGAIGVARPAYFARALDVWAASNALPSGYVTRKAVHIEPLAWWGAPPYISTPRTGTLSGVSSTPNARVMLYLRQSGQIIASTFAAADGSYAFTGLDPSDTAGYFAVALDPAATVNALVADLLTPV